MTASFSGVKVTEIYEISGGFWMEIYASQSLLPRPSRPVYKPYRDSYLRKRRPHHIKIILLHNYAYVGGNGLNWTRASLLLLPFPPFFPHTPRIMVGSEISVYCKKTGSRWVTGRAR